MKKNCLKLSVLFLILFIITAVKAFAIIPLPVVTALNSSTYTAITISASNGPCRSVALFTEDGSSFLIATDSAGTGESIVPADVSISYRCVNDTSGVILYAKSVSGTPNLVVLVDDKS